MRAEAPALTIGDVAHRTGVSPATLRIWEQRHGFPVPQRLASGHRRYSLADVDTILDVVRRREGGVRLDVAVEQAQRAAVGHDVASVYAELRRRRPHLPAHRLRKPTLLALSWAIEDEFCSRAERAYMFGGFQREEFLVAAIPRWTELARVARAAYVFSDSADVATPDALVPVPLAADAPLRREWIIVCDAPGLAAALVAWELPGQDAVPPRRRTFESIWTLDPVAVRDCARVCAQVAVDAGSPGASATLDALAEEPRAGVGDPVAATAMFSRVVAYLDRFTAPPQRS